MALIVLAGIPMILLTLGVFVWCRNGTAEIRLQSWPVTQVYVGNTYVGDAPSPRTYRLSAGPHTFRFEAADKRHLEHVFWLWRGGTYILRAGLQAGTMEALSQ